MKRRLIAWAGRFDALALRERGLVALTAVAAIVLTGYVGFIDPALTLTREAERRSLQYESELSAVRSRSGALKAAQNGPEIAARAELESLKKQLGEVAGRLAIMEGSLVPPERMASQLEEMISHTRLRLVAVRTLPVAPVAIKAGAAADAGSGAANKGDGLPSALYKHGIEIKVEGRYDELVAYLERLEHAKLKLMWNGITLSADTYPKLLLTLTVYTLSLDKTWLIV